MKLVERIIPGEPWGTRIIYGLDFKWGIMAYCCVDEPNEADIQIVTIWGFGYALGQWVLPWRPLKEAY